MQEFEKALRSLLLNEQNDIYITGSNAHILADELATYLSGRYEEFTVSYDLSSRYGEFPYLINLLLTDKVVNEYLKSVYSTI